MGRGWRWWWRRRRSYEKESCGLWEVIVGMHYRYKSTGSLHTWSLTEAYIIYGCSFMN